MKETYTKKERQLLETVGKRLKEEVMSGLSEALDGKFYENRDLVSLLVQPQDLTTGI